MLKQTNHETKTLFLELFVKELILNSKPKEIEPKKEVTREEKPKEEKPVEEKKEITKPKIKEAQEKVKEGYIPSLKIKPTEIMPGTEVTKKHLPLSISKKTAQPNLPILPVRLLHPTHPPPLQKKFTIPISRKPVQPRFTMPISGLPKAEGEGNLGKLNMLLFDKEVTMMECPGPDKFVLVKKAGKINLTKITLSQKEIGEVIENFSERARIPIIGGVFKASVGNLIISAVVSGFVGSRFIIYKASPYSLIEQQP